MQMKRLSEIQSELNPKTEILIIAGDYITILDADTQKPKRFYRRVDDEYELVDMIGKIEKIASYISERVSFKEFLKEFLLTQMPPEDIEELEERIEAGAKIEEEPGGCYSIHIDGKRGRPYELVLLHNPGYDE